MTQPQQPLSTYGAVDLSALKQPNSKPGAPGQRAASANGFVVDVTEATFEAEVIARSSTVPVVVDFWAGWCQPCKQLSPILERLAREDAGRWLLARVDVDSNQRLAGAAGVQSIPLVLGVIAGQAVPLFTGAMPEPEVRRYLDELLRLAVANGVTGRLSAHAPAPAADDEAEPAAPPPDPYADARRLFARGDLDGAAAAYDAILARSPGDSEAAHGRALVEIARRAEGYDPAAVEAAGRADPKDVDAQCMLADVELVSNDAAAAFDRLVATVRATSGEDRERARRHLVELLGALDPGDPRVSAARSALASALF